MPKTTSAIKTQIQLQKSVSVFGYKWVYAWNCVNVCIVVVQLGNFDKCLEVGFNLIW